MGETTAKASQFCWQTGRVLLGSWHTEVEARTERKRSGYSRGRVRAKLEQILLAKIQSATRQLVHRSGTSGPEAV